MAVSQSTSPTSARRVTLRGAADTASLRTATFQGAEYLVVPVVALMEGVIHASNSAAPEFVPAEELAYSSMGWNGRPAVMSHPTDANGDYISANDPAVLEARSFGILFASAMKGRKLTVEAWLSRSRAAAVGSDAEDAIRRCEAHETVDVSVGVFMEIDATPGEYKGKRYAGVWRNIVPDHLAFLPAGVPGACSVDMGCGAPRAAAAATQQPSTYIEEETAVAKTRTWRERLLSYIKGGEAAERAAAEAAGPSDGDVRSAIDRALFSSEPGYLGIEDVFSGDSQVVYAVAPEGEVALYRRGYTLNADGTVDLAADKEQVQMVRRYEAAAAAQPAAPTQATATTPASAQATTQTPAAPCGSKGADMKTKQERVKALIACPKTAFTDADETYLMSLTDERIGALEAHHTDKIQLVEAQPAPVAPAAAQPAPQPTTEEAFLATAPDSIKTIVAEHKAAQAARRTGLVAQLKDAVNGAYTEAELTAMPLDQLEKLAKATQAAAPVVAADFSGRGVSRQPAAGAERIDAPPSLGDRVRALQSQ